MKFFIALVISLAKTLSWFLLTGVIAHGIAHLETEHYQPNDTPNSKFRVAVIDYARSPDEIRQGNFRLQTTPDKHCPEDCLHANRDGTLTYHNEGAMWNSQSTHRIEGNRVIPLSFCFFWVGHVFYGILGATMVMLLSKYLFGNFYITISKINR